MRVAEPITEMAFPRAVAEAKVRAREETVNLHVIKLLAFRASEGTKAFWRKEIMNQSQTLADISVRLGKGVRRFTATEYHEMLYAEPFEHNEMRYVAGLIRIAARQSDPPLVRNTIAPEVIATKVQAFHSALAKALQDGDDGEALIMALDAGPDPLQTGPIMV